MGWDATVRPDVHPLRIGALGNRRTVTDLERAGSTRHQSERSRNRSLKGCDDRIDRFDEQFGGADISENDGTAFLGAAERGIERRGGDLENRSELRSHRRS